MSDIVTSRLVLRQVTDEDVTAVLSGQQQAGWAEDFPSDGDRVIARVLAKYGMPADEEGRRFGHRLVVERESGLVVGGVGFFGPPQGGEVEIGYGIVPSRQRRGYATEVVRAMVADVIDLEGVQTVIATVDLDNVASIRVLEKSGMKLSGRTEEQATYFVSRS
ncbi:MAG: GNAT family N-acetyltransferase [Streptosporangiaceae bacterium]